MSPITASKTVSPCQSIAISVSPAFRSKNYALPNSDSSAISVSGRRLQPHPTLYCVHRGACWEGKSIVEVGQFEAAQGRFGCEGFGWSSRLQFIRLWQFGNIFPPILTGFIERVVKPLHKHIRFVLTPQSQRQEGCVFTGLF